MISLNRVDKKIQQVDLFVTKQKLIHFHNRANHSIIAMKLKEGNVFSRVCWSVILSVCLD